MLASPMAKASTLRWRMVSQTVLDAITPACLGDALRKPDVPRQAGET